MPTARRNASGGLSLPAKRDLAAELLQSVREMRSGRVSVVSSPVIEARKSTGLSKSQFAALLGVSVRTLQGWEQGRKQFSGAARTLSPLRASQRIAVRRRSDARAPRVVQLRSGRRDGDDKGQVEQQFHRRGKAVCLVDVAAGHAAQPARAGHAKAPIAARQMLTTVFAFAGRRPRSLRYGRSGKSCRWRSCGPRSCRGLWSAGSVRRREIHRPEGR